MFRHRHRCTLVGIPDPWGTLLIICLKSSHFTCYLFQLIYSPLHLQPYYYYHHYYCSGSLTISRHIICTLQRMKDWLSCSIWDRYSYFKRLQVRERRFGGRSPWWPLSQSRVVTLGSVPSEFSSAIPRYLREIHLCHSFLFSICTWASF